MKVSFYSTFKVSVIVDHAKVSETNVVKKCPEPNHEHHKTHAAQPEEKLLLSETKTHFIQK